MNRYTGLFLSFYDHMSSSMLPVPLRTSLFESIEGLKCPFTMTKLISIPFKVLLKDSYQISPAGCKQSYCD
jgi:hypothetical protein